MSKSAQCELFLFTLYRSPPKISLLWSSKFVYSVQSFFNERYCYKFFFFMFVPVTYYVCMHACVLMSASDFTYQQLKGAAGYCMPSPIFFFLKRVLASFDLCPCTSFSLSGGSLLVGALSKPLLLFKARQHFLSVKIPEQFSGEKRSLRLKVGSGR